MALNSLSCVSLAISFSLEWIVCRFASSRRRTETLVCRWSSSSTWSKEKWWGDLFFFFFFTFTQLNSNTEYEFQVPVRSTKLHLLSLCIINIHTERETTTSVRRSSAECSTVNTRSREKCTVVYKILHSLKLQVMRGDLSTCLTLLHPSQSHSLLQEVTYSLGEREREVISSLLLIAHTEYFGISATSTAPYIHCL